MGRFLVKLLELIDKRTWISFDKWKMIIERADKETLLYLRDHAFETWKHFGDWMDSKAVESLRRLVESRLASKEVNEWFIEIFKDVL